MADLFDEDFFPNPASKSELDLLANDETNFVEASLISTTTTDASTFTPTQEPTVVLLSRTTVITPTQEEELTAVLLSSTTVITPTPLEQTTSSPSRFSFFSRVSKTFPVVTTLSGRAAEIYNNVKNLNPTLKSSLNSAESTLDGKLRAYEDLLVKVDAFGTRQFDKVEELAQTHSLEALKPSSLSQIFADKLVAPASTVLSQKIDKALTFTERAVNSYVPNSSDDAIPEEKNTTENTAAAPVTRVKALATRVSSHVKNTVAANLQNSANIRVRSAQQVEQLKTHSVDLIKYFNEQIAVQPTKLVHKLQEESGKKLEKGLEVYSTVTDAVKRETNQVKKRLSVARNQAQATVSRLISENLSAISVSQKLQPYLLYVDNFLPSFLSLATRYSSSSTAPSGEATTTVEEKIVNAEAESTQHVNISPLGIALPLPSVTQLKSLLSQRTLKTSVERMLELIAKPQAYFFPAQTKTIVNKE
jgi:hypothetical protein